MGKLSQEMGKAPRYLEWVDLSGDKLRVDQWKASLVLTLLADRQGF